MTNRDNVIQQIRRDYDSTGGTLNERQRRHWAAAEAIKLGRGGITVISKALRVSPNTIRKGMAEILAGQTEADSAEKTRVRRIGGGRKKGQRAMNAPEGP